MSIVESPIAETPTVETAIAERSTAESPIAETPTVERSIVEKVRLRIFPGVYEPREDSLLLARAIEKLDLRGKSFLDMGTGCGIQALVAAKKGAHVLGVDINEAALKCARFNAALNHVRCRFRKSNLFSALRGKRFDVIAFNPPYLPSYKCEMRSACRLRNLCEEHLSDVAWDGGVNGRKVINRFLKTFDKHLENGGLLLLLHSSLANTQATLNKLHKINFLTQIMSRKKLFFEELVVIKAKKEETGGKRGGEKGQRKKEKLS